MLGTLGAMIASDADYFYFMDADVKFNEPVRLMDIAGDLVGVEHPMYPRDNYGWCYRQVGSSSLAWADLEQNLGCCNCCCSSGTSKACIARPVICDQLCDVRV